MTLNNAMIVFRKDWLEIKRNWEILAPIIFVPLIFSMILPLLIMILPRLASVPGSPLQGLGTMIQNLPPDVKNQIAGMSNQQALAYIFAVYFFAPFFLFIPLMSSSVIASDSFAGEKERKTIEALVATPLTDDELLLGKVLVSFIPSMIVTVVSFGVYTAVVDFAAYGLFGGRILLPNLDWLALVLGVAPAIAFAGIGVTVLISARVKGAREAQQLSAMLILPVLFLIFGQVGGLFVFGTALILLLIAVFAVLDIVLFGIAVKLFQREEIIAKIT